MTGKQYSNAPRVTRRAVAAGLGASVVTGVTPFNIVHARGATLKVGVLLPRSGVQAASARTVSAAWTLRPASSRSSACLRWRS